jgi:uncharacterized repeat protein (TIGR03943 family)
MRSKFTWLQTKRGILLTAFGVTTTLWLAATNQLGLYIHPRYNLFSVSLAVIGAVALVWTLKKFVTRQHQPDHQESVSNNQLFVSMFVIVLAFVALLVIKPATLTSNVAVQRGINTGANSEALEKLSRADVISPFDDDSTSQLTLKEWSNLLNQISDQAFFVGKQAKIVGFIAKKDTNPNFFYVSRFVINCCTVDATPIGVPVYMPGWQQIYKTDQWVEAVGLFEVNENIVSIAIPKINLIPQPKDPYVY